MVYTVKGVVCEVFPEVFLEGGGGVLFRRSFVLRSDGEYNAFTFMDVSQVKEADSLVLGSEYVVDFIILSSGHENIFNSTLVVSSISPTGGTSDVDYYRESFESKLQFSESFRRIGDYYYKSFWCSSGSSAVCEVRYHEYGFYVAEIYAPFPFLLRRRIDSPADASRMIGDFLRALKSGVGKE